MFASLSTSWMKPLAPRKHSNIEPPPPAEVTEAPPTSAREVVLGVVTPALSELGVVSRVDEIMAADTRSAAEIAGRWAHIGPIVNAFFKRLGDDPTLRELVSASAPKPAPEEPAETPLLADTEDDTPPPPDPGELSVSLTEEESVSAEQDDEVGQDDEALEPPVSRMDAESHERLQSEGPGDGLQDAARKLYDDVLWLFSINDGEGALISLERLLTMGQIDDEVSEFLDLNGENLLGLYEGYIGPFDKVPMRGDTQPESMPKGYLDQGELDRLYQMIDGERSIADLIDASERTPLETCASIEQLHRARLIEL